MLRRFWCAMCILWMLLVWILGVSDPAWVKQVGENTLGWLMLTPIIFGWIVLLVWRYTVTGRLIVEGSRLDRFDRFMHRPLSSFKKLRPTRFE